MTIGSVEHALAACQDWLRSQDAPEAPIALGEAGATDDGAAAARWVHRMLADQDAAGSWGGELLGTANALLTIHELRSAWGLGEQDPGIGRGLAWIRARRGAPGSWADGCTPARHQGRLCHHSIGGFFSPGPPEVTLYEEWLPGGTRLAGDAEIRLVASATALRALLHWGPVGVDGRLHLDALGRLVRRWEDAPLPGLTTAALLSAIHALLVSDAGEDREAARRGLRLVASKQRGDGSWVETDAFQALDVFEAALGAGIMPDRSRRALWHGARLLVVSQRPDGSWGPEHGPRRALIAARTFRRLGPGPGP